MLGCVHRLQLRVPVVKPLERADRDQLPAAADAEQGDGGVEQAVDLERVRILWRTVQAPELQMTLDECSHVIEPWIGDHDVEFVHHCANRPRYGRGCTSTVQLTEFAMKHASCAWSCSSLIASSSTSSSNATRGRNTTSVKRIPSSVPSGSSS